jgi:hypothetical protein
VAVQPPCYWLPLSHPLLRVSASTAGPGPMCWFTVGGRTADRPALPL